MKKNMIKKIGLTAVLILSGTELVMAENPVSPAAVQTANVAKSKVTMDIVQLIDIAGRQRMLSQRIAKDYMYIGKKIAVSKASKELTQSLEEMKTAQKKLVDSINDPDIQNLLAFVQMSSEDFEATSKEPFSIDNAQLILDLSESMLEGSQYVVTSLKKLANVKASKIVDMAGRQRMLAQRIAKYYIAYQAGIRDKNTVDQMKAAVKLFADSNEILMKNENNTPEINRKLNKINRLWKIVYKFYLNIEKGGLPLIVFNTTDDITKQMNDITGLYVELYK
ncbi:type IV pili methyl-accepting chemotaxis transducer N-terminal domain-containing protein [Sulfurovum sp.]|uniref:type IV pili methyl-accepting chemotaxis transducer N-terminal domain-containing protein n=1 Tax=Sulfurovum sp. TaxID=1969726 RepID=UPI0025F432FA|nr:type IV pili methyl-accepting chemotaxis transducer N-terminal domain-containing protein [Sulfurovum sp.]